MKHHLVWALRRLTARTGSKRLRKVPAPLSIEHIERDYRSRILHTLAAVQEIVKRELWPEIGRLAREASRQDAWTEDLAFIFGNIRRLAQIPLASADENAEKTASEVNIQNLRSIRHQMKAVLEVDVFVNNPRIAVAAIAFVQENTSLIKSVPERYLSEVEALVLRNFRAGIRPEAMEEIIMQRYGVAESRAALIARDQTSKLNGDLTRERQTALGITEYTWDTSRDERVRESHAANQGKRYSWDAPPETGHPGQDYQCRCDAIPVIPAELQP